MNLSSLTHATARSRKDTPISQHPFFRCAPLRLGVILLLVIFAVPATSAQEVADTIKVRTRVVFLDALVKEKKTGIPISDLNPENFEVFDDGQPRAISYFTREGQARKPLALILILDLRDDGAGRFLKRPEILKAMSDVLAKLPPGDEVGIMAMNIREDEQRIWLTHFSNDPSQIAAALARVPAFVEKPNNLTSEDEVKRSAEKAKQENKGKATVSVGTGPDPEPSDTKVAKA